MQSKTPLLLVTALVCGLCAAFGTWKLVSGAQASPAQDETKVKVMVPVTDIQPYCLFQDEKKFTTIEWPKHKLRESPEDTITSFDQIKGKQSRHYKLRSNEPMFKNDICENSDVDIAARLKPGEVAAAIRTDPTSSSGGFIQVGDHVNVAATTPGSGLDKPESLFILNNIEVLAVDNIAQRGQTGDALPTNRMVLRVAFQEALVLKNYSDGGKLDVYKRKLDDTTNVLDLRFSQGKGKLITKTEEEQPVVTPVPLVVKPVEEPKTDVVKSESKPEAPKGPEYDIIKHKMRVDDGIKQHELVFPGIEFKTIKPAGKGKENEKDKDANAAPKENGEKKAEGQNKEPGK